MEEEKNKKTNQKTIILLIIIILLLLGVGIYFILNKQSKEETNKEEINNTDISIKIKDISKIEINKDGPNHNLYVTGSMELSFDKETYIGVSLKGYCLGENNEKYILTGPGSGTNGFNSGETELYLVNAITGNGNDIIYPDGTTKKAGEIDWDKVKIKSCKIESLYAHNLKEEKDINIEVNFEKAITNENNTKTTEDIKVITKEDIKVITKYDDNYNVEKGYVYFKDKLINESNGKIGNINIDNKFNIYIVTYTEIMSQSGTQTALFITKTGDLIEIPCKKTKDLIKIGNEDIETSIIGITLSEKEIDIYKTCGGCTSLENAKPYGYKYTYIVENNKLVETKKEKISSLETIHDIYRNRNTTTNTKMTLEEYKKISSDPVTNSLIGKTIKITDMNITLSFIKDEENSNDNETAYYTNLFINEKDLIKIYYNHNLVIDKLNEDIIVIDKSPAAGYLTTYIYNTNGEELFKFDNRTNGISSCYKMQVNDNYNFYTITTNENIPTPEIACVDNSKVSSTCKNDENSLYEYYEVVKENNQYSLKQFKSECHK